MIGDTTAERIKQEIGAFPSDVVKEIDVRGRNLAEGIPRSFALNSHEILEALQEPLQIIVQSVKGALEQTPPELAADIAESACLQAVVPSFRGSINYWPTRLGCR